MRFIEQFHRQMLARPDHPAILCRGLALSYAETGRLAAAMANRLRALGVAPRARVVVEMRPQHAGSVIAYLGVMWRGAVAVPVEAGQGADHCGRVAALVDAAAILQGDGLPDPQAMLEEAAAELPAVPKPALMLDISDILFSSGSTGRPKGVTLSHANIAASIANINAVIGTTAEDREVVTIPLSHSFGLGRMRCVLSAGGTLILASGLRFPGMILGLMDEHRATGLSAVPTALPVLFGPDLMGLEPFRQQLAYVELGSMPFSAEAKEQLRARLPDTRIVMHYGLTEASRSAFLDFHRDRASLESVGLPAPGVRISIRDTAGEELPPGQTGEIVIAGPTVTPGYWRDPERTARQIGPDGALHTGDMGALDAEGFLHFAGRQDNVINIGGRKVSAEDIERVAERHPAVREAGCVGQPDATLGSVPYLFVVPDEPGEDVAPADLAPLIAAEIGQFAMPRRIVAVAELPRTRSGKLRRHVLRERLAQRDIIPMPGR